MTRTINTTNCLGPSRDLNGIDSKSTVALNYAIRKLSIHKASQLALRLLADSELLQLPFPIAAEGFRYFPGASQVCYYSVVLLISANAPLLSF